MNRVDIDDLTIDNLAWHDGSLFSGTSVETWPDGTLRSEQDFENGMKSGHYREYDRKGQLIAEVPYRTGVLHGLERHFFEDGQPASETYGQYGIVLWRKAWDERGKLIDEFEIDKNGYQYQRYLEELAEDARGKAKPE